MTIRGYVGRHYDKNRWWLPFAAFLLGFLFDVVMLRRIDDPKVILQQALYLVLAAILVGVELVEQHREISPPRLMGWAWRYRKPFLDFLLGTLLNGFAIFYFKSASAFTSFVFIVVLGSILTLNEFRDFGKAQTQVHVAYLSLCLISFFISLAPTVMGFIGVTPFLCAMGASVAAFMGYRWLMCGLLSERRRILTTHLTYPYAATQLAIVILYFVHAIPPVPLSVQYMGIYHQVERSDGEYRLGYLRQDWKFWQHEDQVFKARPGDVIYCYAQIFSPTRFKDQLQVRWLYRDGARGWISSDVIPLDVVGGREEGYRAVTKKANYVPGTWRVQVETKDGEEVGRTGCEIVQDDSTGTRDLRTEVR
jgi:hypothetical protein